MKPRNAGEWWVVVVAAVVVGVVVAVPVAVRLSDREEVVTVRSREAVPGRDGHGREYLIFCDEGVYRSADDITFGKVNSADVYNAMTPGKTFRVRVAGWRVPLLSMFPNVIEVWP